MHKQVGQTAELSFAVLVIMFPALEARIELLSTLLNGRLLKPTIDRVSFELDENSLATVFHRWQPGEFPRQWSTDNADL